MRRGIVLLYHLSAHSIRDIGCPLFSRQILKAKHGIIDRTCSIAKRTVCNVKYVSNAVGVLLKLLQIQRKHVHLDSSPSSKRKS